jgi:hypothetical protein
MFSRRNPARTALLTAHWESPENLKEFLSPLGCGYHYAQAFDRYRLAPDGTIDIQSIGGNVGPMTLYTAAFGEPSFMKVGRRT